LNPRWHEEGEVPLDPFIKSTAGRLLAQRCVSYLQRLCELHGWAPELDALLRLSARLLIDSATQTLNERSRDMEEMKFEVRRGMTVDYKRDEEMVRPAIVLEVWSPDCVNLYVFFETGPALYTSVVKGTGDGQWQPSPVEELRQAIVGRPGEDLTMLPLEAMGGEVTVGRTVLYKIAENVVRPATVVSVNDADSINVQVHLDGTNDDSREENAPTHDQCLRGLMWRTSVHKGDGIGEWRWPELAIAEVGEAVVSTPGEEEAEKEPA
jgi:hypothetical protein